MSDAFPEPEVLEERSLEFSEHAEHRLPDDVDEADALDQYRDLIGGGEVDVEPLIAGGVDEADAIDQARPVGFEDDDDWRDG